MFGKVVVTGGAGFIGSHLVERLSELSAEVVVFDNLSTGTLRNLEGKDGPSKNVKLERGNINEPEKIRAIVEDVELIFHEAALVSVTESLLDPDRTFRVNVEGTRNVVCAAVNSRTVEKMVFASSSAVYGDTKVLPTPEDSPTIPISPYGQSKLRGEEICLETSESSGLDVAILRYYNVYGERSTTGPYSGVIYKFAERLLAGESPQIYGDGRQSRDFVNVGDIVGANIKVAERMHSAHKVFNVGTGSPTTILELAQLESRLVIGETLKEDIFEHLKPREGDILHSYCDISRIRREIDFSPAIDLETGLNRYLVWLKTERPME